MGDAVARRQRGLGIALLAILTVFGGGALFVVGLLGVLVGGLVGNELLILGVMFVGLGLFLILAGLGLWRLKAWAWWLDVAGSSFSIAGAVVGLVGWTNAVLPAIILVYLLLVKDDFRIGRGRSSPKRREGAEEGSTRADRRRERRRKQKRKK